jgi:hypothetical protein
VRDGAFAIGSRYMNRPKMTVWVMEISIERADVLQSRFVRIASDLLKDRYLRIEKLKRFLIIH